MQRASDRSVAMGARSGQGGGSREREVRSESTSARVCECRSRGAATTGQRQGVVSKPHGSKRRVGSAWGQRSYYSWRGYFCRDTIGVYNSSMLGKRSKAPANMYRRASTGRGSAYTPPIVYHRWILLVSDAVEHAGSKECDDRERSVALDRRVHGIRACEPKARHGGG